MSPNHIYMFISMYSVAVDVRIRTQRCVNGFVSHHEFPIL